MIIRPEAAPKSDDPSVGRYCYFVVDGLEAPLHLAVSITGDERTGYDIVIRFLHQPEIDYPYGYSHVTASKPLHYDVPSRSSAYEHLVNSMDQFDRDFVIDLNNAVIKAGVNPFDQETLDAFVDYVSSR